MDQNVKKQFTEEKAPKSNKHVIRFSKLLLIRKKEIKRKQDHSTPIRLAIIGKVDYAKRSQRFGAIEILILIIAFETVNHWSHSGEQTALLSTIRYMHT